ncbi:hypothetical protein [Flavobacterium hydatis]|uniref:Uncharacterized protein n=1 Tax=Flavobacterium hydatis TaxID=991 RepID=A0A086A3C1_FLAHY|nr:hypothetical protein [Flavobacterium hydatis]KFF11185.1 hypothetical protein IW20_19790 [Flavobacterium hydatis]OXA97844.1 hypothetical protein B0A62_03030 [Flavobacterium hydatis]
MNKNFIEEQFERFKAPWKNSAFNYYFYWIIIGFGGIGIWLTIYEESNKSNLDVTVISKCIATTAIAIISASLVDLNLSFNLKNVPSLIINSIAFFGISIFLLILSFNVTGSYSLIAAVPGYLIALLIWVLANSDNGKLSDESYFNQMTDKVKEMKNAVNDL